MARRRRSRGNHKETIDCGDHIWSTWAASSTLKEVFRLCLNRECNVTEKKPATIEILSTLFGLDDS